MRINLHIRGTKAKMMYLVNIKTLSNRNSHIIFLIVWFILDNKRYIRCN